MRGIVARELIVAARTAAVALAACGIAALLTAFVVIWSPGVSLLAPMNLYEQSRLLHWILLAAVLPWTAVRSASADRGDAAVIMIALTGLGPTLVVAGKVLAMFTVLVIVILTALPALVIAQQAAAVPLALVFSDLLPILGLALLVAVSSTASALVTRSTIGQWLMASTIVVAVLIAAMAWVPERPAIGLLCALAGGAVGAWLHAASGRSLLYLNDSHG